MLEPSTDQTIQTQTTSPFYSNLSKSIFHGESEKSFVDKMLGRQDADRLHELIKKEPLTLSDVEEILFLMTSIDQKLLNYDEWDRYVIVKLFPWIKDFSIIVKTFMIYEEDYLKGRFDVDFHVTPLRIPDVENVENVIEEITVLVPTEDNKKIIVLTEQERKKLEEVIQINQEINKYLQHDFKFLISTFLLVSNTTLSINGAAFDSMITSKFEYSYPSMSLPQPQERKNIFNILKFKR